MTLQTKAVFENGCFVPLIPVEGIPEHSTVNLSIEAVKSRRSGGVRQAKLPGKKEIRAVLLGMPADPEFADAIESGRKRR